LPLSLFPEEYLLHTHTIYTQRDSHTHTYSHTHSTFTQLPVCHLRTECCTLFFPLVFYPFFLLFVNQTGVQSLFCPRVSSKTRVSFFPVLLLLYPLRESESE